MKPEYDKKLWGNSFWRSIPKAGKPRQSTLKSHVIIKTKTEKE